MNNYTVLFADSDISIHPLVLDILNKYFRNVIVATTKEEASELFRINNIDLVIADICETNIDGLDFIEQIREKSQTIPIIVQTACSKQDSFIKTIRLRVSGYLLKPIVSQDLEEELIRQIDYISLTQKLRKNENLLNQYKDAVDRSLIVSKTDPTGVITYVNEEFCRISGYKRFELLGRRHNIIRHPDTDKEIFQDLWYTIKILKQPWSGEIKNKKKNGEPYWVKTIINPILGLDGEVVEFIGIRTEITEQILLAQKLKDYNNINN